MISSPKQTFLVTGVSDTLISICVYNLLALHSPFFNVFTTWCELEGASSRVNAHDIYRVQPIHSLLLKLSYIINKVRVPKF